MRMKRKFLRRDWNKILRLGGRRKKLKWRRSKGRHAKIRQKWKGYSQMPSVGYKGPRNTRNFIEGKKSVLIHNMAELIKLNSNEIGIISKTIGKKSKIELAKKALELKSNLLNLDASEYLEHIKKEQEEKKKTGEKSRKTENKPKKEAEKKEEVKEIKEEAKK